MCILCISACVEIFENMTFWLVALDHPSHLDLIWWYHDAETAIHLKEAEYEEELYNCLS